MAQGRSENLSRVHACIKKIQQEYHQQLQKYNWQQQARPSQCQPQGSWRTWLILAGRGFGKTRTGAETVRRWALHENYRRIALIAETENDARQIMIEGTSGLLNVHPESERPCYEPSRRTLTWANGAIATCYSAENYEQLRGPQFDAAWIDELAKFRYAQETWDQLNMALRLGKHPKVLVTTTPRPIPLLRMFLQHSRNDLFITRGNTYENADNLAPGFIEYIKDQYENSPFGRQEIFGEIVETRQHALWDYDLLLEACVSAAPPELTRIVVAVDPAATNHAGSDETGIVVAGKDAQHRAYILDDLSGKFSCREWSGRAVKAFHHYKADMIIAEVNKGGDMVREMLRAIDPDIPFKGVHATRSKITRAEPVAALYRQQRVFHVGRHLKVLESQLCSYTPNHASCSPDRLDALVWAVTELLLQPGKPRANFRCWSLDPA